MKHFLPSHAAGGVCFQGNIEYYSAEVELNAKFRTFVKNCSVVFAGHNTVKAQLKLNSKRGTVASENTMF